MKGKPVHFAYGIKLVALWMLIPFVLMFIPRLANEFKFQMTTAEVMLKKVSVITLMSIHVMRRRSTVIQ